MHAILGRDDFRDIVAWLPHGRSWRVLKPREFEIKVIPMFFEHAKFSSFVRQANGWGFRRITQGKDRNSYYHEKFLRGMPHLCKSMKRPGVNEKKTADPEHEPDLYKITELHPVPEKTEDDSFLLHCTVQGGPKARMPIYLGPNMSSYTPGASLAAAFEQKPAAVATMPTHQQQPAPAAPPAVIHQVQQPPQAVPVSPMNISPVATAPKPTFAPVTAPMPTFMALPTMGQQPTTMPMPQAAAAVNPFAAMMQHMPGMNPAAASQFAAGFAAATAFSQQHFCTMFEQMAKQQQQQQAAAQAPTQN